jgi:hypothetical protein
LWFVEVNALLIGLSFIGDMMQFYQRGVGL